MTQEQTFSDRKQQVAAGFNLASVGYDRQAVRFLALTARRLVEIAAIETNENILDVATGTGHSAIAISTLVGARGRVIGIDIAPDMLTVARQNITKASLNNIQLQPGDAEHLSFEKCSFGRVVCASGIFFLPDMLAGLKEWLRVTKPGGVVAFSSFGETAFNPMREMYANRIQNNYGVVLPASRGFQRLNTIQKCQDLMQQAGFCRDNIKIHPEQLGYHLQNANEWWDIVWHTGFRHSVSQILPEKLAQFKTEHLAEVEKLATDKGIWLDVPVIFALGKKSA
ncbi:class I SAM-dependent methyltransferase [Synechocystis sp. PCC 7509]|uniref:class I SAM-dependent methyltransferase n=1 Tax=Synechocystis sp. PCC 7509 TaxID=927677 RepID=UPI0002ACB01D|nr:class I SAM-dependent methyltransferase [Synechocystis sp. PCC 7509]